MAELAIVRLGDFPGAPSYNTLEHDSATDNGQCRRCLVKCMHRRRASVLLSCAADWGRMRLEADRFGGWRRTISAVLAVACCWLIGVAAASPVHAHAGYRHPAPTVVERAQAQANAEAVRDEQVATLAGSTTNAGFPVLDGGHATRSALRLPQDARSRHVLLATAAFEMHLPLSCPCGSTCGGCCASSSCCGAALAAVAVIEHVTLGPTQLFVGSAQAMSDTTVAPLPRPPNTLLSL